MRIWGALFGLILAITLHGQEATVATPEKHPLAHADYDRWESLKSYGMDGMGDLAIVVGCGVRHPLRWCHVVDRRS